MAGGPSDLLCPVSPAAATPPGGGSNSLIPKLSADGKQMVHSTILGGAGDGLAAGVAVDASGNAYLTGATSSEDFPTTAGALRRTLPEMGSFTRRI